METFGQEVLGTKQAFDIKKYQLRELFVKAINDRLPDELKVEGLDRLDKVLAVMAIQEIYDCFYGVMDQKDFRDIYQALVKERILELFDGVGHFQIKPGVRIQLLGGKTVQYHTDEWYGHGDNVINCWLPLTKATGSNSLQVATWDDSVRVVGQLEKQSKTMAEINEILARYVHPAEINYGEVLIFNTQTVHGSRPNTTNKTRVSLDFRLLPEGASAGSKSVDEYYEKVDQVKKDIKKTAVAKEYVATAYIYPRYGFTQFVSPYYQRLVVRDFAKQNNIELVAEETEIKTMKHHPILWDLAKGIGINDVNAAVLYSVLCLPEGERDRLEILKTAESSDITLFFANEGIAFPDVGVDQVNRHYQELMGKEHVRAN